MEPHSSSPAADKIQESSERATERSAINRNDNGNLVEIRGVSFRYNTRTILDNLTLSIPRAR